MLTTFTYLTTVLKHSNTIVKTREETISNVITQKYRPTIDYTISATATASLKAEPSSIAPEVLASYTGPSKYFTDSLTTTYIYYNTFAVDDLPVILTSRETVTNVVTLPIYMSPSLASLMVTASRIYETETYFTTYTFSKTFMLNDATSEVVTTKEIITQVVVTEALAPPTAVQEPGPTPVPPNGLMDEITKTYLTTFTHLFTEIDSSGQLIIRSSTSISSEVVTETISHLDSKETQGPLPASIFKIKMTANPTFTGWFKRPSTMSMEPIGYITMRSPATLLPTRSNIQFTTIKPTSTVNVLPETLEPVMIYATKTYYTTYTYFTTVLADGTRTKATVHSRTQIVSKVVTEALSTSFDAFYLNALKSSYLSKHSTMIDITSSVREVTPAKTFEPTLVSGTLVTQGVSHPHYPKDNDELAVEVEGTTVNSISGVEVLSDKNPVQAEIQVSSASSEEHFDEIKNEVNHIVNVLQEGSEESPTSTLSPSTTQEPIYSTGAHYTGISASFPAQTGHVSTISLKEAEEILPSHQPTPPLQIASSPIQPLTIKPTRKKPAFNPFTTGAVNLFPDIGKPGKPTMIDLPSDLSEYSDEAQDEHIYSSLLLANRFPHSTSILAKRTGTMVVEPSPIFNPSQQILSLVSQLANGHHWSDYEDNKESKEEIPSPNIYNIHTTFDSFSVPTSQLIPVPLQSIDYFRNTSKPDEPGGDMKIHTLSVDDVLEINGSGSGSGEGPIVDEITITEGSGGDAVVEDDYRETDHTAVPEVPDENEEAGEVVESFHPITEDPYPAFPPRTKYTTSTKPKRKKTKRPSHDVTEGSSKESGESSTKVYSLKVPNLDILTGQHDSVSDESDNVSENKKESEQDDQSSESAERERPQDEEFGNVGPSKSTISFPAMGPGVVPAPGGPAPSSTHGIDWKPLLKLGAIGLGGLGASSLTKIGPWFNSMAGSFMKGSLLPLARNDTSSSGSHVKGGTGMDRDRDRPIFHRYPPGDRDHNRRPIIQHSDPVFIPINDRDRDDDRIPRRPITSHAKDPNQRPVSLERERDRIPPGRGYLSPDLDFPPKHIFNFKPPNDHLPNIYTQSKDLHKNGEYKLKDPNLRVIHGPLDSPSEMPEGKTDVNFRPFNILNGKPVFEHSPKPGPAIPLRPPPFRNSGERRPGDRERRPDYSDSMNDVEFDHPRKPDQPMLRPVPPTDGIILPHRIRGEHNNQHRPPPSFKRPFIPPQRHPNSKEEWPRPLRPFNRPNSEEILHMKPPPPPQKPSESNHPMFSDEDMRRPPPPPIHMEAPQMPDHFESPYPSSRPPLHHHDDEASEENVFKDIFGVRLPPTSAPHEDHHPSHRPEIPFHPHNAGSGPFRPLASQEQHPDHHSPPPHFDIHDEEFQHGSFSNLPELGTTPQGVAGQPSDKFGHNEDDLSHEESLENPYQKEFENEFKKLIPSRKPIWPPHGGGPISFSYLDEINSKRPEYNEISSSPPPHDETYDIHIIPPSQNLPPHRQRPSTIYSVHQEEMEPHHHPTTPSSLDFNVGEASVGITTQFPKLIIKEIPTRPVAPYYRRQSTTPTSTTTPSPFTTQSPANRASIAKLFIRKFTPTTPASTTIAPDTVDPFVTWRTRYRPGFQTTPSTNNLNQTIIDSWLVSPTVNDLQDFLEDFKNNFSAPSSTSSRTDIILPQRHSSTTTKPLNLNDDDDLGDSSEYEDDLDDELSVGAASSELNSTLNHQHHPNHSPVHKPPIDADHFFSTGQGDFAQYYSGTEERDTVIDPANEEVIKSPYDRRNTSSILRFRPTLRPVFTRNNSDIFTSSTPTENEIVELPGPTTYRPRFDVTFHNKMGTTSEEPIPPNPTTFRGDVMKPTTFRPGPDGEPTGNRVRGDPTRDKISGSNRRPAPQDGVTSFYDDSESMDQLKMKNKEIMKLPSQKDVLEAMSDEEFSSSEHKKVSTKPSPTTPKSSLEKPHKKGDEYGDDELYSEEYDSTYDEDAYLEIPPAIPTGNAPPGVPPSTLKNSAEGKHNNEFLPNQITPPPPPNSRRPGPIEMLTNFFRRPQGKPPSGPGGRIPFIPNSSREPTRVMLPPGKTSKERPELEYQANAFDPNKKTIPLNPSSEQGTKVDDPIVLMPKDRQTTTSPSKGSSGEITTTFPGQEQADSNKVSVNTGNNNNGIRESTYIEQDSEYYEDDELMEEDDKNNVISPDDDNNGQRYTGPPIKFQPTIPPSPKPDNRPITIGGHLVNNGFIRPPTANQRRPPLPLGRLPGNGRPSIFSNIAGNLQHIPPLVQNEPSPPRTEMEPPPIDSNRLKAPILELPSSGPIRYRPVNNVHRPNLLRPDDELFKPTTKASKTVHTIASVDDQNKIIATNTFTAILPTRYGEVISTESDVDGTQVHLEGSESSVAVPHSSTGTTIKMTSIVRYTSGRLETTAIEDHPPKYTRGPNIIIPTRSSSIQTLSTSSAPNNRVIGLSRRPPPFNVRESTTSSSSTESNSPVRVTVTMESSVSSTEADSTKKPFIPMRTPTRGTFPWMRKSTSSSTETTTAEVTPSTTSTPPRMRQPTNPTEEPTPTSKESNDPRLSIFNIKNNNRLDILRRTTVVPPRISAKPSDKSNESIQTSIEGKTSGESNDRPSLTLSRSTTFKPFRRPTLSFGGSSSSKEKFTTALINKVHTSEAPSESTPSVFSGIFNGHSNSTGSEGNSTSAHPASNSSEYEYSDEEYEDEDFELDGEFDDVSERPSSRNSTSTERSNDTRVVTTSSSMSVSTSMSINNETRAIKVSSSEITPTRVTNKGGISGTNQKPKGIINTMVLRGSMTRVPELPATTKYITHSETETKTLTETETTVVVTAGTPYTHTIMITKTVPPQTLISTVVGSVTLVNSVDVRPTTVRSTIFAQPTKEVYSFVDTSEDADEGENDVDGDIPKNKVVQGGILGGNRPRPGPTRNQTPPPNVIPKVEPPTTMPPRSRPGATGTGPSATFEQGCPANCTLHGNQACRPYNNGTRYKCDCKPGYARLKRKFLCRAIFTYELTLAINHMDGMSFDFKDLQNSASQGYNSFITVSKDAIDKAFLSTDIKRQFQGSEIRKLRPFNAMNEKTNTAEPKVYVDFLVQLTTNVTEDRIRNHLIRTLKSSNFSVGRTGISSTRNMSDFGARDFNECSIPEFNDCSENADCLNLRGSFSCRCRAGYRDKSPKKHKPGRDCYEMLGCPECNYKGHCRINAFGEPFCECFRWFGGSKCHINLKILLFAIMGVVAILFIFVLLCSVLVCRRTKIRRERPGSGRFMRYRSPTSQATLDRAAIMNDSASSDGRQSPLRMNVHSFTPDSLLIEGDPRHKESGLRGGDSLISPDNVHLMNFSLRNVIMDQDRSLTVVIPRAKIRPPSRPPSIHATLGPDAGADLAQHERKLINYLDHSPYPPAPYPSRPMPGHSNSRQGTIKRHDSRQFRKLSLQEQRKISSGALVSSGTEVSARGGMRRRSIDQPEPTYSGYEKSFSDLRSITDTMRSPAQPQLFSTDTSRTSCYSHSCKPPSYCAYSEKSVGHTMGDKDGASTVYTTQGKLFRMTQDDTDSTTSSH